jgi:superfamily II DNA/RNA helicase
MSGENGIIAAETGNGKTLAFLLPIIQQVLEFKRKNPQ